MLARIFAIASDAQYEPGLRALLNSLWVYYRGELAVFIYHQGFSVAALDALARHPNRPQLFATADLPFPPAGMWEAKQQIFAHCLGRARCVYLLDADLVLTSRVDDVFELAEQGKIISSSDGGERAYGGEYGVYGPSVPGRCLPYLNSGALCLDVNRHWDLAGLWAFASKFGTYSPGHGYPLHLPGHGDQGTFNALAALLDKGKEFHALPEATWCDSTQGTSVQIQTFADHGQLEVWNVTAAARQRLVHSSGPKWWTEEGRRHLAQFGDKLKCFEHFHTLPPPVEQQPDETTKDAQVLVGICSCHRHASQRATIRETWAQCVPPNVRVVFFIGAGAEPCDPDVWSLPCPDTYETLPQKVQAFLRRALTELNWDYVFKCDDDTYVMLERLGQLIGTGEFIGNAESVPLGFASGGAGYLISRRCARLIAEAPEPERGAEDLWVSRLLQNAGVKLSASSALQAYHQVLPNAGNDRVTAHWCSEELLRVIHAGILDPAKTAVVDSFHATHAAWSGPFTLLQCGYFLGGAAGPDGRWELADGDATLCLKWIHWGEDRLGRTASGYTNASLRLERVPSPGSVDQGQGAGRIAAGPNGSANHWGQEAEKLHLGAGPNPIPGWRNHDLDMDLRRPLPIPDASIGFLFAEHVVEHVTPAQAWKFFKEARRVLKPGGALRIAVPCVDLIAQRYDAGYAEFLKSFIGGDGSRESAMDSIIGNWGHQAIWTVGALRAVLESLGFKTIEAQPGRSHFPEMEAIDGHTHAIGAHANRVETGIVEALKASGHNADGTPQFAGWDQAQARTEAIRR